jgi:hypothetical protein
MVEEGQTAPHLEGADRRVVLMLDPDLRADPPAQQRPGNLGRRRHHGMNQFGGSLQFGERRKAWYCRHRLEVASAAGIAM